MSQFGAEKFTTRSREVIETRRLRLVPLSVEDAEEMAGLLDDARLHEFIGGRPATVAELRDRYTRLAADSPDPHETWLNWIVRRRAVVRAPSSPIFSTSPPRAGSTLFPI